MAQKTKQFSSKRHKTSCKANKQVPPYLRCRWRWTTEQTCKKQTFGSTTSCEIIKTDSRTMHQRCTELNCLFSRRITVYSEWGHIVFPYYVAIQLQYKQAKLADQQFSVQNLTQQTLFSFLGSWASEQKTNNFTRNRMRQFRLSSRPARHPTQFKSCHAMH